MSGALKLATGKPTDTYIAYKVETTSDYSSDHSDNNFEFGVTKTSLRRYSDFQKLF